MPLATEFELIANAILLLIILRIPKAASETESPSGSAICLLMASLAREGSMTISPPKNCS